LGAGSKARILGPYTAVTVDQRDAMQPRQILLAHDKDLGGGFRVRRLLPSAQRQAVGPFLFFDHFGPVTAQPADQHDVRPHPHIGLATVTYLFEGAMLHRDSTGVVQRIEPGAINWMTAGRGIVHSERTPEDLRGRVRRSHGLQLWAALPLEDEEMDPGFAHTPASAIPVVESGGATVRVLIGQAFGRSSPVATRSPTLYLDIALRAGAALKLPPAAERALYAPDAPFTLDGQELPARQMVVLRPGEQPLLAAAGDTRVLLIGGEPLGHRFMVWNFVSSRKERIVQAQDDWRAQRFAAVPGETEFIPLP
jgi:redox-sensitive bicupin YhaK (pirin superfamily)